MMHSARLRLIRFSVMTALIVSLSAGQSRGQAIIVDHNSVGQFESISTATFDQIRSSYNIFYGRASHGKQIMYGLYMLAAESSTFALPSITKLSADLGYWGGLEWVGPTRTYLDSHPECNLVMWAWCDGVSSNTEAGIDIYLSVMTALELDYPGVTFVYMTGHVDGSGADGNLYRGNNQIRDYCRNNDKILYDFADIESYDPDGTWYPDDVETCNWCTDWCATHECPDCEICPHSHCFNCYRKAKAFWWMMNQIIGAPVEESCCVGRVGDANTLGGDEPTIGDVSVMIDARFILGVCGGIVGCMNEADVNQSGGLQPTCEDITIGDISVLIDYLFITGSSLGLAECL